MVSSALVCLFVSLFVSRITQKLLLNRFSQNSSVVVKIFLGLETLVIRSRDLDRDPDKMNSSALESRDHGLEITSLAASILDIGDRALA